MMQGRDIMNIAKMHKRINEICKLNKKERLECK